MKKKDLEKAIILFDETEGCSIIDNYIAKLSKEEINELSRFIKFVFDDINKTYDHDSDEEYIDSSFKKYICQMSEVSRCTFEFSLENEGGKSIESESETDISMIFSSYEKSTWVDKFKIAGKGFKGGIDINELHEWSLLTRFIIEKNSRNAKPAEINNGKAIVDKLNDTIQMLDLSDIGNE